VRLLFVLALCSCADADATDTTAPGIDWTLGDALTWQARSPTSTFWETTDVAVVDNVAYTCTGVASLVLHNISVPADMAPIKTLRFDGSNSRFPRCSHIDRKGDRMVVTSRRDEIQPRPWVALLDVSDAANPKILDEWSMPGDGVLEEGAIFNDQVYVAAPDEGVLVFDISGGSLKQVETLTGLGRPARVSGGEHLWVGTTGGTVYELDADHNRLSTTDVAASVQALLELSDGRATVALGSSGLAVIEDGAVSQTVATKGTAVRLQMLEPGRILLANWTDLRVYDDVGGQLSLRAVDAVFQADDRPRHLAAAAGNGVVVDGEWSGIHTLTWDATVRASELTPSELLIAVAADGEPKDVQLVITNEGQLPLTISKLDTPTGWSSDADLSTIEPHAERTIDLHFNGSESVTTRDLVIHSDDVDEPKIKIPLRTGSNRVFLGDEAPVFTYTDLMGSGRHSLKEQHGNVVLLSYFATF
jgi:hypothetical protein